MQKLTVAKLVDFRRKSERAKKTFVENIKSPKIEAPAEGGGDYWIPSVSALSNCYKEQDLRLIGYKIDELEEKFTASKFTISKNMYQRNIDNLKKFKTWDLKKSQPSGKIELLKRTGTNSIITIKALQVEVKPHCIFKFKKDETEYVGAILFVAKLGGYKIEEIGMAVDLLYRYLKNNYSKKFSLLSKYCIVSDVVSAQMVSYSQIEKGGVVSILTPTIDEINKLM